MESPLSLVLCIHLRIFAYSSNNLIANFVPCLFCSVAPRPHRRDSYWLSARDRARRRYWSVTSLMRLNSKVQKMPAFVSVGGRNAMPSGLSRQNLACAQVVSLLCQSCTLCQRARKQGGTHQNKGLEPIDTLGHIQSVRCTLQARAAPSAHHRCWRQVQQEITEQQSK